MKPQTSISLDESDLSLGVSEFIALFNQTIDFAYPSVSITGELANFRVSRNRWVYFDLKDDDSVLKFFGTVYQLPGPLEDGMLVKVRGNPKLHNLYGFSINIQNISLSGEGTIRRAANLLQEKLAKEGLFDESRKRQLPYPPVKIGLITSTQSAAYFDFQKIMNARWVGAKVEVIDVQVQGEAAPIQIVSAVNLLNAESRPPDVIVIIRGGGSAEDLAAFNTEQVTRSIASSRVPTLVAIGHEVDISLAELAADQRASTPSNAAELIFPDVNSVLQEIKHAQEYSYNIVNSILQQTKMEISHLRTSISENIKLHINNLRRNLESKNELLNAFNPEAVLDRGYSIIRDDRGKIVKSSEVLKEDDILDVQLSKGGFKAKMIRLKS